VGVHLAGSRELVPVPAANSIARPGVDRLLDQAPDRRVTVIAAGPGWGKTTLVARWLASARLPDDLAVAWLTIEPGLNGAASFWDGALRSIRASGAVPAGHPLSALSPGDGVTDEVLRLLHQGFATLPGRALLVLDDFHLIDDPEVLDHLFEVISRHPRLSVMLLTRVQPLLPLHRLRLTGDLLELTSADLAFDAVEVADVARALGVDLTAQDTTAVLERTQGWPAGVRLATLYLSRTGSSGGIGAFTGTERSVAEYLLAEVLEHNTPANRDFLVRTSVTGRISADLAEAIAPGHNAQAVLETLVGRNEFVTALGADRVWFRYHPLLRDLLEHTLRRDHPDAHRDAHRAAATWLGTHGEPISGLGHATAAGDWALFTEIFTTAAGPSLVGSQRAGLEGRLIEASLGLPETAESELCRAGLDLLGGRLEAVQIRVDRARAQLGRSATPPPAATVTILELLTSAAARHRGDAQAVIRASRAALAALDGHSPFPAAAGYRAIALTNLGIGLLWSGDATAAQAALTPVIDQGDPGDVDIVILSCRANMACCDLILTRLDAAGRTADETLADAADHGWSALLQARPAHLASAWVRLLRGDTEGAGLAVARGLAATLGGSEPAPITALHLAEALVAVSRNRPRAAVLASTLAQQSAQTWAPPPFLADLLIHMVADVALLTGDHEPLIAALAKEADPGSPTRAASRARLHLATGDLPAARDEATAVTAGREFTTIADLVSLIDAWLVTALAADLSGQALDAATALRHAVEIAGPHNLVRPFLVTGSPRTPVLLRRLADGQIHRDPFLVDLVDRTSTREPATPEPAPLREALTGRELAMLAELPTMKSNAEIAAEYYVSVNTVKAHLKGLYRKLDVDSRRAAVHRARDLGLLT
jgi:LuxR family maltose regulon positive regulatory protein